MTKPGHLYAMKTPLFPGAFRIGYTAESDIGRYVSVTYKRSLGPKVSYFSRPVARSSAADAEKLVHSLLQYYKRNELFFCSERLVKNAFNISCSAFSTKLVEYAGVVGPPQRFVDYSMPEPVSARDVGVQADALQIMRETGVPGASPFEQFLIERVDTGARESYLLLSELVRRFEKWRVGRCIPAAKLSVETFREPFRCTNVRWERNVCRQWPMGSGVMKRGNYLVGLRLV